MSPQHIKVRFPPSPTGYLHIGSLRTVLYNYLFAQKHHALLALRVEDTDRTRYVTGAVENLIRTLEIIGLTYDEGPYLDSGEIKQKGNFGPYIQSERLDIYQKYAQILLKNGHAYYCFCSSERLDALRKEQELAKMTTKYDRRCCSLTEEEIHKRKEQGEPFVIRLRIPEGETKFEDVIRGTVSIKNKELDDQVLMKSDGYPTYHLANVIDDHLMEVTHVIRGEEWLSSVPKHILLYRAFEWQEPVWAHLPLILNPDKSKLSKRQGDVSVEDFLQAGYLPETLLNFVALLGFNPKADQELYTKQELIDLFDLTKVNKSGAVFDKEKLLWMNKQYIRQKTDEELTELLMPYVERAGKSVEKDFLKKISHVEKERLEILSEITLKIDLYMQTPAYESNLLIWKKADQEDARKQLQGMQAFLKTCSESDFHCEQVMEEKIKAYIVQNGLQNGNVLWPTRVALSGSAQSPNPFELLFVLGKEISLERLQEAIEKLS